MIVTRFAPSPTGYLHIGGARTALFNWLYAKRMGGKFLLRIEDTDRERNTPEAVSAIHQSLAWLGINSDEHPVYQSQRAARHVEVAMELLNSQNAYYDNGAIRIKGIKGSQTIHDIVQGEVTWNQDIDDFVILRSDGTPTYMLAVVVDDHDMGVTHVIRGDDHLNNAFRQMVIYKAMGWTIPTYAHIPLIHSESGKKYSKRDGAAGVMEFAEQGILPEALFNYLVRLGWSHGDDEIMTREQAIEWFDIKDVRRAPSRFNQKKLLSVNAHYIANMSEGKFAGVISRYFRGDFPAFLLPLIQERSKTLEDAVGLLRPLYERPEAADVPEATLAALEGLPWAVEDLEAGMRAHAIATDQKLGDVVAPLRLALTGSKISLPLWPLMVALGREETLARVGREG